MGHFFAGEVANSQASNGLETVRAGQARYIMWCYVKYIPDPLGPKAGSQVVLTFYIKCVMTGVNYLNKDSVRSITCENYGIDAASYSLFEIS